MKFRNSCFLSYRAGSSRGVRQIYETFSEELQQQTELYMPGLDVFLDKDRLAGGQFFADVLARELCQSVCMIVLFSPEYFDTDHTFCAREYAAMVELEKARRARCSALVTKGMGLIIPVIIRGSLPQPISKERHYYSLSNQLLAAENLRRQSVREILREIADQVYTCYSLLRDPGVDLADLCSDFALPSEADVMTLVNTMSTPPAQLPWQ